MTTKGSQLLINFNLLYELQFLRYVNEQFIKRVNISNGISRSRRINNTTQHGTLTYCPAQFLCFKDDCEHHMIIMKIHVIVFS